MADIKWTDLATPDPEFKAFYDTIGPLPKFSKDVVIPIAAMREMSQAARPTIPGVTVPESWESVEKSRIMIPVRDGSAVSALLYRPVREVEGGRPLIVAYHGGGWCLGTPEFEEVNCVNAVQKFGAVAVSVDYRLAPEYPFPTPVNDAWDSLKWIAANASSLQADPSRGFIVHGESAGANFAVVLAHLARDEKLSPPLTGVSASIPAVLSPSVVPDRFKPDYLSYEQNRDAPGLDAASMEYLVGNYNPDHSSPLFNPFNWPTGHQGLPPVFFQVCGKSI
ncbi:putative lipase 2 [Botryosphaeria dothidea]|uniref:Lipase 2 n=1 Tax=Botryosphaeria dothidea TaxID=55169 RepID=A0A8H4IUS5_9PEZI|nr:putative lipase 2 [Botryosphaeria dothidea]